jgi:NADPH:quinone reductase-like Zn-dependent oxidoreductase
VRFGRPRKLNPKQGTLAQPFSSEGNLVRQVAETFIVHAPTIYPLSGGGRLNVFSVPLLPNTLEAASIWMMFVTAYGALIEDAKITAQDAVVIPGASSSVGLAAIQIANSVGAKSIALTRTSAKRKQLTAAGAKYVIATEEENLLKEIDKITGGQGARVVFDPVGGPTLSKLIKAMSFQGLLYLYGALSDQATTLPVLDLIGKIITIKELIATMSALVLGLLIAFSLDQIVTTILPICPLASR